MIVRPELLQMQNCHRARETQEFSRNDKEKRKRKEGEKKSNNTRERAEGEEEKVDAGLLTPGFFLVLADRPHTTNQSINK